MIIKSKIYYFDEIESTSDYMKTIAADAPEGTIVIADSQTRAHGRRGHYWYAPEGGLWLSVLLVSDRPGLMQIIGSVAVCEALANFNILLGIKWPNDLMLNSKKIGGIIAEPVGDKIVLGIGLNLTISSFPVDLETEAASLFQVTKKRLDKMQLLDIICKELDDYYNFVRSDRVPEILAKWRNYTIMFGRMVKIETDSDSYAGRVIDINADGALVIMDDENNIRRVLDGECRFT